MHQTHRVVQKTALLKQYIGLLHCFHHMAKKLLYPSLRVGLTLLREAESMFQSSWKKCKERVQLDSKAKEVFKWCPWAKRMFEQSVRQETHPSCRVVQYRFCEVVNMWTSWWSFCSILTYKLNQRAQDQSLWCSKGMMSRGFTGHVHVGEWSAGRAALALRLVPWRSTRMLGAC